MSNSKIRRAVVQVGLEHGACGFRWQNNTRHEMATIRFPSGKEVKFNVSMGMNFDEVRVKKTLRGILRRQLCKT